MSFYIFIYFSALSAIYQHFSFHLKRFIDNFAL